MIFTFIHKHRWASTPDFRHGERVSVCLRCGDRAFGVEPEPPQKPRIKVTFTEAA